MIFFEYRIHQWLYCQKSKEKATYVTFQAKQLQSESEHSFFSSWFASFDIYNNIKTKTTRWLSSSRDQYTTFECAQF